MQPACLLEYILGGTEDFRQDMYEARIDLRLLGIGDLFSTRVKRFNGTLTAYTAAGAGVEMTFKPFEVDVNIRRQVNANCVRIDRSEAGLRPTMFDLFD